MSNYRTAYRQAATLIQRGWQQGSYELDGCICMLQALALALGITTGNGRVPDEVIEELFAAIKGEANSKRTVQLKREYILTWHDHPRRRRSEIVNLLSGLATSQDNQQAGDFEPTPAPRRKRIIRRRGPQPMPERWPVAVS